MDDEEVVLVNDADEVLGSMEKLEAHRRGLQHRAFSVFLFDGQGRMLLQQRATGKYHSALLWTNACCGHPRPGEDLPMAARRRLKEELGIEVPLVPSFTFHYAADLDQGMHENEVDHVFFGAFSGDLSPDPREVGAVRWASLEELDQELRARPERFTVWLAACWDKIMQLRRHRP